MVPPESVCENIYAMTEEEREKRGIRRLPRTMGDAIEAFRNSSFIRGVLGNDIYEKYLAAKEKEWEAFCTHVTDWEVNEYLRKY